MRRRFEPSTVSSATRVALVAALLTASVPAVAGKVYRCGNVFQDRPCPVEAPPDARPADKPAARATQSPSADRTPTPADTRVPPVTTRPALDTVRAIQIDARR